MNPELLEAWRKVAWDESPARPETITMPRAQLRELVEEIVNLHTYRDLWVGVNIEEES